MPRIITPDRLEQIRLARERDPEALGPMLAEFIIVDNVPVEAVAGLMCVSDVTVYRWMYGMSSPRDADKIQKLKRLLTILRKASRAKDLPLAGTVKDRVTQTARLVERHRPVPKAGA